MEHYKRLGVSRIHIMDYDSSRPAGREIADHISSGFVVFFFR